MDDAFLTPKASLICSEIRNVPWSWKGMYAAYYMPHEKKPNIDIFQACNREKGCDIKRSFANLIQKHIMVDHATSFEKLGNGRIYVVKRKGKKINIHFQPALNKRAGDIYGWINVIVKKYWSFNDVNDRVIEIVSRIREDFEEICMSLERKLILFQKYLC